MFNWKDWTHPLAGGAEEYTRQFVVRWAKWGHRVRLYTSRGRGQSAKENLDGVEVFRNGGLWTVHGRARAAYLRDERPDVVLDEVNTRPFHAPRFSGRPTVAFIYQLAREFWFRELPYPVAWLGYHVLELRWLRPYFDVPTATLSPSTAEDLASIGFKHVTVVYVGCSVNPLPGLPEKEELPTLVFLGRLTKAKQPDHALEAFRIIRQRFPKAQLWVLGDGYLLNRLASRAPQGVTFMGRVTEGEKCRLLSRAHALLVPSVREGWGLVVTEANALGTPAVAYRVPGLRDSVKDGITGVLTDPDPRALGKAALALLSDEPRLGSLAANALQDARGYSWDRVARDLLGVLEGASTS